MDIERVRRRLRLRDLETLVSVVRAGAMRKAAISLHASQPAVSRAIQDLESALDLPLLERGRRGVQPTPFGETLARRSEALLDQLSSILRELAHQADPEGGEVRLGCMETLHAGLVGAAVARSIERHPRVRFILETGQAADLVNVFLRGMLVDFVVARPLQLPLAPEIEGEPLFRDRLLVVAGPSSPLARRRRLSLAELVDQPWILGRNETLPGSPTHDAFRAAGLALPGQLIVSGSLHTRYNLLRRSAFLTVVPHSLLPFDPHRDWLRILPVSLPVWHSHTMIMTLRGRMISPAALRFLETLREMAGPLDVERVGERAVGGI